MATVTSRVNAAAMSPLASQGSQESLVRVPSTEAQRSHYEDSDSESVSTPKVTSPVNSRRTSVTEEEVIGPARTPSTDHEETESCSTGPMLAQQHLRAESELAQAQRESRASAVEVAGAPSPAVSLVPTEIEVSSSQDTDVQQPSGRTSPAKEASEIRSSSPDLARYDSYLIRSQSVSAAGESESVAPVQEASKVKETATAEHKSIIKEPRGRLQAFSGVLSNIFALATSPFRAISRYMTKKPQEGKGQAVIAEVKEQLQIKEARGWRQAVSNTANSLFALATSPFMAISRYMTKKPQKEQQKEEAIQQAVIAEEVKEQQIQVATVQITTNEQAVVQAPVNYLTKTSSREDILKAIEQYAKDQNMALQVNGQQRYLNLVILHVQQVLNGVTRSTQKLSEGQERTQAALKHAFQALNNKGLLRS